MGAIQDHYLTLGVLKATPPDEIRRAYRKLAIKLHPDRNPGNKEAETRFKVLSEAYDTLSNFEKKSKYDREREEAAKPKPEPNYPVADVPVEVELDANEVVNGCEKTVTVSRPRTCPDCRGSGHVSGPYWGSCDLCRGTGCQPCGWTGRKCCARCWGTGSDRELTMIRVNIPAGTPQHGRRKFVAHGELWGLRGPFYVWANVTFKIHRPGLIVR